MDKSSLNSVESQVGNTDQLISTVKPSPLPLNEFNGGNNFPIFDRFSPTVENKPKFSNYLYFNVSVKTNTLMQTTDRYSTEQQELHDKIKSLYESGMSYRKITKHLNDNNILTPNGKRWGVSGNSVYSVLKKHQMRLDRLEEKKKEYEPEWGKMEVRWEKNV